MLTLADSVDESVSWPEHKAALFHSLESHAAALSFCTAAGYATEIDTALFGWLVDVRALGAAPASTETSLGAAEVRRLAELGLGTTCTLYHPYADDENKVGVTPAPLPPQA